MKERTVLVTGASQGIGLEFVRQYVAAGCRIIACSRAVTSSEGLNDLQCQYSEQIEIHTTDVSDEISIGRLKGSLKDRSIDILINNAGIWGGDNQSIDHVEYDLWTKAFAVNAIGPFRMIQAFRNNVTRSSERKIILISSEMGSIELGGSGAYVYRSSKAAANRIFRSAAEDLKDDGILALTIHPGWVLTAMGTPHATYTPEQSVIAMRRIIALLNQEMSGSFVSFGGKRLPW